MLRGFGIAGLALAASIVAAAAQEMKSPRISSTQVDWDAAVLELAPIDAPAGRADAMAAPQSRHRRALRQHRGEPRSGAAAVRHRGLSARPRRRRPMRLAAQRQSRLRQRITSPASARSRSSIPAPPATTPWSWRAPRRCPNWRSATPEPIYIHIGGSALVYELDEPVGMIGWPVHGLEDIPGIRRLYLENYVRYTFVRYGVPYVVAIECSDAGLRFRKDVLPRCRQGRGALSQGVARRRRHAADAAGRGRRRHHRSAAGAVRRSSPITAPATSFPAPASGAKAAWRTTPSIRRSVFRSPTAPAFANSQSFMNWGNCEATGRYGAGKLDGVSAYRCRVSGQTLISDESAAANYSYPWRDNFCEHRYFYVGQCPGGLGHQGQDIRPASCKQRIQGANRCEPYLHDVVAVRDGAVLRAARPGGALHRGQCAERAPSRALSAHAAEAIRRRRNAERPPRARGRGDRQGRQLLQARAGDHVSPAFRPAGPDPSTAGYSSILT